MIPLATAMIISAIIGGGGAAASAIGQAKSNAGNRESNEQLTREQLAQNQKQFESQEARLKQEALMQALLQSGGQKLTGQLQAAEMAGASPLSHQMDRNRAYLQGQFLNGNFRPSITAPAGVKMGNVNLPTINSPFLTQEALASSEVPYFQNQRALNPDLPDVDLTKMGYGDAGISPSQSISMFGASEQDRSQKRMAALLEALTEDETTAGKTNVLSPRERLGLKDPNGSTLFVENDPYRRRT